MTHRHALDELLTVHEVAALLKVSPRTVQRYASEGRLPSITLPSGRGLRFRRQDIDNTLAGAA